jgi:hypothetical protein
VPKTLPRTSQDLSKPTKNRPKTARRSSQRVFFMFSSSFLLSVLRFLFSLVSSPSYIFLLSSLFVLLSSVLSLLFSFFFLPALSLSLSLSLFRLPSLLSLFSLLSFLFSVLPRLPNCGGELYLLGALGATLERPLRQSDFGSFF